MTAFIALLKNDIKVFLKDWKAGILLIVMPVLFIYLFVYVLTSYLDRSSFVDPFKIALADNENTTQTRVIGRQLDEVKIFSEVLRVNESKANELIRQNKIAALVIIPKGFSESLLTGENKPVTVTGNKAMPLQSFMTRNLIQGFSNLFSAGESALNAINHFSSKASLKGKEIDRRYNESMSKLLMEALARNEIFTQIDDGSTFDLTPAEYFTAALLVIFLMFSGMPGMKMLVWEKYTGITRRLMTTSVKPWHLILTKFVISVILSAVQFSVIIVLTSVFFKNYWGAPVKSILLLFGSINFAVSAWSVFVSSISGTPAAADVIGNLGILLMAIVGGSIYPLTSMPEFVRSISKFTINRWAMDGFMVIFSGNDAMSIISYIYPLLAIGLVLLGVSAAAMRLAQRR